MSLLTHPREKHLSIFWLEAYFRVAKDRIFKRGKVELGIWPLNSAVNHSYLWKVETIRPHSDHPKLSRKYSSVPPVPNPSKIKCPSLADPDTNWCQVGDNQQGSIHFFSIESTLWSQRSELSNPHFDKNESGFTNWQTTSALLQASIQCPLNVTIGWSPNIWIIWLNFSWVVLVCYLDYLKPDSWIVKRHTTQISCELWEWKRYWQNHLDTLPSISNNREEKIKQ